MRQFYFNEWGRGQRRANLLSSLIILAVIVLLGAGCGDGGDDPVITDEPQPPGGGFSISAPGVVDSRVQLEVGQTLQFTPTNANFTSSNPTAATITSNGLLTGVTAGQTTVINATNSSGRPADNSVTVSVITPRVPQSVGVVVSPGELEEGLGGQARLLAFYETTGGTVDEVRDVSDKVTGWLSSHPTQLSVSSTGSFTANSGAAAIGLLEIQATVSDPVLRAAPIIGLNAIIECFPVRGSALSSLSLSKSGAAGNPVVFFAGPPKTATVSLSALSHPVVVNLFQAEGTFADSSSVDMTREVIWKSSNPRVIDFPNSVSIAFLGGTGSATITAERLSQAGGTVVVSDQIEVTVNP